MILIPIVNVLTFIEFETSFHLSRKSCSVSCTLQMHPALNPAPSCIYVYFSIIPIILFLRLKFFTRFSSNPFQLLGLSIRSWFIHHTNARHELQILNFLIFLLFLFPVLPDPL